MSKIVAALLGLLVLCTIGCQEKRVPFGTVGSPISAPATQPAAQSLAPAQPVAADIRN